MSIDFLDKKIVAYLHDPPWKMWVLTLKKALLANSGGHEGDAIELIKRLGVNIDEIPIEAKMADRLASSIDRWILSEAQGVTSHTGTTPTGGLGGTSGSRGETPQSTITKPISKLNMFSPCKEYKISIDNDIKQKVSVYVDRLTQAVSGEKANRYHLLYFLAPLIWYEVFNNIPPLADTRVPTHTIFDHATATAAMMNIIECENDELRFKGSIVSIEIPSIQEFISYSRKSRDLWASSWLSSVLLWKSIESFVESYGPDIVVRPELSLNHFFIAWLYNKVNNAAKNTVLSYAEKFANFESPRISMMSEKVVLLLPTDTDDGQNNIEKKLEENFNEAWKTIAEHAIGEADSNDDYIKSAIEHPPIKPIIHVKRVKEVYEEYKNKLKPQTLKCGGYVPLEYSLFFEYLYRVGTTGYKKVKYSYGTLIHNKIQDKTKNGDYSICTVCGILPAARLYYHPEKDTVDNQENDGSEDRLCPYCAIKRALKVKVVNKVLQKLGLSTGDIDLRFPSTSELAMMNFAYHLKSHVKDQQKLESTSASERITISDQQIDKIFQHPEAAEYYCRCYSGDQNACSKPIIPSIVDDTELKNLLKHHGNLYYAIIKADGDFLGSGYWSGNLRGEKGQGTMNIKSYMETVLGHLQTGSPATQISINQQVNKIIQARAKLYNQNNDDRIPITPSYVYTLTRALTVQAVIDKYILEENNAYPIYLGGDDMLALSPIRYKDELSVVRAVMETRKAYWTFSDNKTEVEGFKSFKGLVADSLSAYGRSYSVFMPHYKDPLTLSVFIANYLLELKDDFERGGKDVVFISAGRGQENLEHSVLKMSEDGRLNTDIFEAILYLDSKLNEKKISRSYIYDSLNLKDYTHKREIYKHLVKRVIERNTDETTANEAYGKLNGYIGKTVEDREVYQQLVFSVACFR